LWNQTITPIELTPLSLSHTHGTAARAIYIEGRERNKVEKREKEGGRKRGREEKRGRKREIQKFGAPSYFCECLRAGVCI
jgi:hypothetical protein